MRTILITIFGLFLPLCCAMAQDSGVSADSRSALPFEVVRQDVDLEVDADGRTWKSEEMTWRALTTSGVQALQQMTVSYTSGYQQLSVVAYTRKQDGRRIDVPQEQILQGRGDATSPGFFDTQKLTVIFPDLQVGDQAVLTTRTLQLVPWFAKVLAETVTFPRSVVVQQGRVVLTTRGDDKQYLVSAPGMQAEPPVTLGGKTRRVWRYSNDKPLKRESAAVSEYADLPHVAVTTLPDHARMAAIYAPIFAEKGKVTPEIQALAQKLTDGVTDRRVQARRLYDWVATNIQYVNIVLGAGGFVPHEAGAVLKNGFGDCKDHVMLLQALLEAKGIDSSPVLIRAGANQYQLPATASPFVFDHLISYIPEFDLFLDSTSRHAPFGVLPSSDMGKAVVIVKSGRVATTPAETAQSSQVTTDTVLTIREDGSAEGVGKIVARGSSAVELRALMSALPPDADPEFFRGALGPGSDGAFQRGTPEKLENEYSFGARYQIAHVANIPGPGALPSALSYKPFSFSQLIGLDLPITRTSDYACESGSYRDTVTVNLPKSVKSITLPAARVLSGDGAELHISYRKLSASSFVSDVSLRMTRPPVCRAANYSKVRPMLTQMVNTLRAQVLYQ